MTNQNNNDPNQSADQMYEQSKQAGKQVGKKVADQGKNVAKKATRKVTQKGAQAAKKLAVKLGKQAIKLGAKLLGKAVLALVKGLMAILSYIGIPVLIVMLIVGFLAAAWYIIDLEDDGNEQKFFNNNNETVLVDAGKFKYKQSNTELRGENGALKLFYTKIAQESFWQILPDKKDLHKPKIQLDKLELFTDTKIHDEYNKENQLYLSSTLLFLLDDYMHEGYFIYPEQFTKPLYADGETMELLSFYDENKNIVTEVDIYDEKAEKTDKKQASVANYGLASILVYMKDQIFETVEGEVTGRQYYDEGCECIQLQSMSEPFKYHLPGSPKDIHLIEKASTIDGLITYKYERQKTEERPLSGTDTDRASDANRISLGKVDLYKKEEYTYTDEEGNEVTETIRVKIGEEEIFEFREGAVYLDKPVEVEQIVQEDMDFNYLDQYLLNYEALVPKSVMQEFNFEERMDGYSASYPGGGSMSDILNGSGLETGSKVNTQKYKENYVKYFAIFKKYTDQFGGDPYLLLAKMMLESGGNPNINADGLMQITGGSRTVKATRLDGSSESFTISVPEKKDPDKAIKFAVMYNKNKLDAHGGNDLKALQAYNFDLSGFMKSNYPTLWATDTDWIDFAKIEEARLHYGSKEGYGKTKSANYSCLPGGSGSGTTYGNTCYLPMVLQYYAGSNSSLIAGSSNNNDVGSSGLAGGGNSSSNSYDKTISVSASTSANPNAKTVTNSDSYLVVVNKDNKLASTYVPSDLRKLNGVPVKNGDSTKMRNEAASSVEKMINDAKKAGVSLGVFSGYRSYADQEAAFNKHQDETISAKPGYSEHQTGLAADIVAEKDVKKDSTQVLTTAFGSTTEGKWLVNNAHKYGFIIRYQKGKENITGYQYEPWHLRYVGISNATNIAQKKITLEEAIVSGSISGTDLEDLKDNGSGDGSGDGAGSGGDFDVSFEKEKQGLLGKLLGVILGNNYKEEVNFYNFRNHISYTEIQDIRTELVTYQRKIPYSLVDLENETLKFVGTIDSYSASAGMDGGTGEGVSGDGAPTAINTDGLSSPLNIKNLKSKITSRFGWRDIGAGQEFHGGVDVGVPTGTPLYSIGPGKVSYVEPYKGEGNIYRWGWGSVVWIDHQNGVRSIYAHLSKTYVNVGQTVTNGTLIALSGHTGRSTGPHLHFELRTISNNKSFDSYNVLVIGH